MAGTASTARSWSATRCQCAAQDAALAAADVEEPARVDQRAAGVPERRVAGEPVGVNHQPAEEHEVEDPPAGPIGHPREA